MKILRIVAINALILVGIVVILELAFGGWVRSDALNRLNLVRDRQLRFETAHLYPSAAGVAVYTRDRYGLRGGCGDPARITLLTVGGSTTDQRYLSDDATWQAVLQRRLKSMGKDVCIGNAGVDGQSTIGHLKNFDWWFPHVPGLKPRQILFYVGINDFYTPKQSSFDDLTGQSGGRSLRQLLREYSAIYHAAYTLYGNYQAKVRHQAGHGGVDLKSLQWTRQPLRSDHEKLMAGHLRSYRERLHLLVRRSSEMGALPILVTQPARWQRLRDGVPEGSAGTSEYEGIEINGVDMHRMLRLLDSVTCEVAAAERVPCVDLGGTSDWEDGDFYDFAHMTPSGAEKLAERLGNAIAPIV